MTIAELFLYFVFFSFVGWTYECLISLIRDHKIINRGFLNGPYCPIYGCGAVLFYFINIIITAPIALFLIGGTVACVLEYITSYVMEKLFRARWWDYKDYPLNLNGRICLYGFLIFGAGAILSSHISAPIASIISGLRYKNQIAIVLVTIMALDAFTTNKSFARFNKLLREYQKTLKKGTIAQIIQRNKRKFEITFLDKPRKVLTYQQRRILKAFPGLQSRYDKAYSDIKTFYKSTKYKPTKHNAHARKKSKKILK